MSAAVFYSLSATKKASASSTVVSYWYEHCIPKNYNIDGIRVKCLQKKLYIYKPFHKGSPHTKKNLSGLLMLHIRLVYAFITLKITRVI